MNIQELRRAISTYYKNQSKNMDLDLKGRIIQSGLGFFPYGSGLLIEGKEDLSKDGLMVIGQDFGTIKYVSDKIIKQGEADENTFSKTVNLLDSYPKEKVFLTNLFIGLRKVESMLGINPALQNKEKVYLDASFEYFKFQVQEVKPSRIIVLGKVPYHFIIERSESKLEKIQTFGKYIEDIQSGNIPQLNGTPILCIPHPSMWNSNVKNKEEWIKVIEEFGV